MSASIPFNGEIITSRQNRRIVELMKLDDRRAREKTRTFRFDGVKLLCEAIRRGVEKVFILDGRVPHALLIETLTDEGAGTMVMEAREQ